VDRRASAEEPALLGFELLVGDDALLVQLGERREQRDRILLATTDTSGPDVVSASLAGIPIEVVDVSSPS
jgi:hypothetical protein